MNLKSYLVFSSKISAALRAETPVLAIAGQEILCKHDQSSRYEYAKALQDAVSAEGAEPAFLFIINGQMHIGVEENELLQCCKSDNCVTLSNVPLYLAQKECAAACASAAIFMAGLAGIRTVAAFSQGDLSETVSAIGSMPIALITNSNDALHGNLLGEAVPVYHINSSNLSPSNAALICQIKWDLGLTSGVCFCGDNAFEIEKAQAALQNAVWAAKIAFNI
ncbi:MAG: pseudouridine-5'-phosphate glycosidase [Oscillospiraceae bacterium]